MSDNKADDKQFAVCVFCGSSPGTESQFIETAKSLGAELYKNDWSLVYGGGTVGLMGAVASSLVALGGNVHGIIPKALVSKEQTGTVPSVEEFGKTTVVRDMHSRKAMMGKEANAFVALPGGFGTMEELFEITTWNQVGIHDCPIVVLNLNGFYDGLLGWIRMAVEKGFISENASTIISEAKAVEEVAERIKSYKPAAGRFNLDWKSQ
ncbi:hypothetical protein L873DRAFT_1699152 [Choiromyces venosus 120613-1]|uniref:Cytokinin riboside 5'-monophosphate phosphoribohydrolase n=1 Tax=Choiromyces venosus 120613-1 TaxID=1336337 RepID=A0A3N4JMM8_9PEZI|nr:hypothetical protein L873DRAFT_1699152 [Choiromyces venosus 120613-1]